MTTDSAMNEHNLVIPQSQITDQTVNITARKRYRILTEMQQEQSELQNRHIHLKVAQIILAEIVIGTF